MDVFPLFKACRESRRSSTRRLAAWVTESEWVRDMKRGIIRSYLRILFVGLDFRCHEEDCAALLSVLGEAYTFLVLHGESEVHETQLGEILLVSEEDVLCGGGIRKGGSKKGGATWLDVSMNDVLLMDRLNRGHDVVHDKTDFLFIEWLRGCSAFMDELVESATTDEVHHDVAVLLKHTELQACRRGLGEGGEKEGALPF